MNNRLYEQLLSIWITCDACPDLWRRHLGLNQKKQATVEFTADFEPEAKKKKKKR